MISKKRLFSMLVVSFALAIFVAPMLVGAEELWDPHLRGVNEGLDAGALPPTGLYFINNAYWATYSLHNNNGDKVRDLFGDGTNVNSRLDAYVDVPILLWVPGCDILGAKYGVAIAQPFDYTNSPGIASALSGGVSNSANGGNWGTYNTVIVPYILSWSLPYDLHVATNLSVYIPDASTSPYNQTLKHDMTNGGLPSGNGYWAFEPGVGISWLHDGWNVSADLHLSLPLENESTHYTSAPEFWADYTIAKTIGKWTIGLGAYEENQTGQDKDNRLGGTSQVKNGKITENFGMGPIVGYNFGPVIVSASYNWGIYTKDDVGGDFLNVRMIIPIPLCGM